MCLRRPCDAWIQIVVAGWLCACVAAVFGCAAPGANAPPPDVSLNPVPVDVPGVEPAPSAEPVDPEPAPAPEPEPEPVEPTPAPDAAADDPQSAPAQPPVVEAPPLHPAWSAASPYNQRYLAEAEPVTLEGEIESVGTFVPAEGAEPGLLLGLKTANGVVAVHAAPLRYLREAGVRFDFGETLTVEGRWTELAGERVLLAQAITRGEVRLELRDAATGRPLWIEPADADPTEGDDAPPSAE